MAKQTVKNGIVISVENKNPVFGANDKYIAIWVEDVTGKDEFAIMLTEAEFAALPKVYLWNSCDMTLGRLYPVVINNKDTYFVKLICDKTDKVVSITQNKVKAFSSRAEKNKEDIPKKGFLADLLD